MPAPGSNPSYPAPTAPPQYIYKRGYKTSKERGDMASKDHVSGSRSSICQMLPHKHPKLSILLIIIFALIFILTVTYRSGSFDSGLSPGSVLSLKRADLSPTLEKINGTQLVWQIPEREALKAVLFIAHGCGCKATFFWDPHPLCKECIGLPEERALVIEALTRGYAVIAISSKRECWSVHDSAAVQGVLTYWIQQHDLQKLPLVGLGASSGGYFLSGFALQIQFRAVVIMIAEGEFDGMNFAQDYPSTLFVHMPKDRIRAMRVHRAIQILRSKKVDVDEIQCFEMPLHPLFLSQRIPGLDERTSERIYAVLKDSGILNEKGYMIKDGRAVNWQMPVRKRNVLPVEGSKLKFEHHILEELNLAFSYHEMTSIPAFEMFNWLDRRI